VTVLIESVKDFIEKYKEARLVKMRLDAIKSVMMNGIKNKGEEYIESLTEGGLDITTFNRRRYNLKDEEYTKEVLWNEGILPMVTDIPARVANTVNIESAVKETKKSVRIYSGSNRIVSQRKEDFIPHYENLSEEELTKEFQKAYTELKYRESERDEMNSKVVEDFEDEDLSYVRVEGVGNIRLTERKEVDHSILFDVLKGKKEVYIRQEDDRFHIEILPEEERAILPKGFKLLDKKVEDYFEEEEIEKSLYIKKSEFNKKIKEGYKGFELEVDLNPKDFFFGLPIQKTKVEEYIEDGLLPEDFIEKHYNVEEVLDEGGDKKTVTIIVPEGVAEMRREYFLDKLEKKKLSQTQINRANNLGQTSTNLIDTEKEFAF